MNSKPLSPAKQALLEQRLRGARPEAGGDAFVGPRHVTADVVLSPGQQRLWFLHQLAPDSSAYTMAQAWHFEGPLDTVALRQALNEVVLRHSVLRQTFDARDGLPVPVVAPSLELEIESLDVRDQQPIDPPPRDLDLARHLVSQVIRRPFDLRAGPLVRAFLVRLDEEEHVFGIALHHIVCDEWSLQTLWRELSVLYGDAAAGRPPSLAPPAFQYADYSLWQRGRMEEPSAERHIEYWRRRLGGEIRPIELPLDRPRPARQRFKGALETLALPGATATVLTRIARDHGVTNFVLMLAAFDVLLHRYTGSAEIVVGAPVTGRIRPEFEGLVGFFLNSLVLHTDLSGDPAFTEVLRRVEDTVMEALAHQDAPFETLVDALQPRRGLSHNPLFQVMFVLQQQPDPPRLSARIHARPFPVETGGAKLDVTLFATEQPDGLDLTLEYDTDLLDRTTAHRMLEHMCVLLEAIAADPGRRISELPLMTGQERRQLLVEWSMSSSAMPRVAQPDQSTLVDTRQSKRGNRTAGSATPVLDLILAQAAHSPDAVAIESGTDRMTYGELVRRTDTLARELERSGVGTNVCVGVCAERSPDMIVGILAVMEAGGAYVPLDPSYPTERHRFVLEDTGAPVVLTQRRLLTALPPGNVRVQFLDDPVSRTDEVNGAARITAADASHDRLAYVIHTSGSTGKPKGVAVTQRNLARSTGARLEYYDGPAERFLLLPSFAFDSSVAGIFWTLCTGGTLVIPPPRIEQDPHALAALISRHRVTHTLCLPSIWDALLEHAAPSLLDSLRTVVCAGEPLPAPLALRHLAVLPRVALYNEYGPTEATVWCTVFRVADGFADTRVPIGRPIPGARVHVLDDAMRPVPIGVPGELFVGGDGVARGYLGREAETTERFVTDPFAVGESERLYRTGDRVRWRADGNLEFLGRTDHQLKIRGYRIEPAEIETALRAHPAVRDCVVAVHPRSGLDPGRFSGGSGSGDANELVAALLALDPDVAARILTEAELCASDPRPIP